jgi:hypothetical protein
LKRSAKNIKLTSVDEIFSTEESRTDANRKKVMELPLAELYSFKNYPFRVVDDGAMRDTAESIEKYGVLVPAIARPRTEGGYELVAGHRRFYSAGIPLYTHAIHKSIRRQADRPDCSAYRLSDAGRAGVSASYSGAGSRN